MTSRYKKSRIEIAQKMLAGKDSPELQNDSPIRSEIDSEKQLER